MKIAVLYCGHPRDYKQSIGWWVDNFINNNDFDVFALLGRKNKSHTIGKSSSQTWSDGELNDEQEVEQTLFESFGEKLKRVVWVDEAPASGSRYYKSIEYNVNEQLRKIYSCYCLMEEYSHKHRIEYTHIVRVRPDNQYFPWRIDLSRFGSENDEKFICARYYGRHVDPIFFSLAPKRVFEKFLEFSYSCDGASGGEISPETACLSFLKQNNITVAPLDDLSLPISNVQSYMFHRDYLDVWSGLVRRVFQIAYSLYLLRKKLEKF